MQTLCLEERSLRVDSLNVDSFNVAAEEIGSMN